MLRTRQPMPSWKVGEVVPGSRRLCLPQADEGLRGRRWEEYWENWGRREMLGEDYINSLEFLNLMRHTPKIVHCHISGDFERWQRSVRTKRRLSAFFSLKSTKIIANLDGQQSAYFTLYAAISTGDNSNGYSLYRANTHPVRRSLATCTLSFYVTLRSPRSVLSIFFRAKYFGLSHYFFDSTPPLYPQNPAYVIK